MMIVVSVRVVAGSRGTPTTNGLAAMRGAAMPLTPMPQDDHRGRGPTQVTVSPLGCFEIPPHSIEPGARVTFAEVIYLRSKLLNQLLAGAPTGSANGLVVKLKQTDAHIDLRQAI
jgi:hypothetical protein